MIGACAKRRVFCHIKTADGYTFSGENVCQEPQARCPREPGEGYEKCKSICKQVGHAEEVAIMAMREYATASHRQIDMRGSRAVVIGHDHVCESCMKQLVDAGVESVTIADSV